MFAYVEKKVASIRWFSKKSSSLIEAIEKERETVTRANHIRPRFGGTYTRIHIMLKPAAHPAKISPCWFS